MDRRFAEYTSGLRKQPIDQKQKHQHQQQEALWELLVQQEIPPAANVGIHVTDWLPDFNGFSWIGYGAGNKLVIRVAPSKDEFGSFLQVLGTSSVQVPLGNPSVLIVNWCSSTFRNVAYVAAAAGNIIYIYAPTQTGAPLEWKFTTLLVHPYPVAHFSWSSCGDGILSSSGYEVFMWKQGTTTWDPIWKFICQYPQSMVAATFSYRGLAASADESSTERYKGRATVWWWDENSELREGELSHPREVLGLQWRPVSQAFRDLDELHQNHRPVLLTLCKDGVVRLWLEIDSGKARSDKHTGKDVPERSLKPAFFVSAFIDIKSTFQVSLGLDYVVTWASEMVPEGSTYIRDVNPCEWVVGIGPRHTMALWSLHCLDDVNPSRCPRVLLWKQGTCTDTQDETAPSSFQAVIQRPQSSVPPAVVEMFKAYCGAGIIRWTRTWPPVSAISGGGSIFNSLLDFSTPSCSNPSWGCSSEEVDTGGHTGDDLNLALHPVRSTGLAATADRNGMVLLWYTKVILEVTSLHSCGWKLCGRITGERMLPSLCWLPMELSGGKLMVMVSQSEAVNCYLLSPDPQMKRWCDYALLHRIELVDRRPLKNIWCKFSEEALAMVSGVNQAGYVYSWSLQMENEATISSCLLNSGNFEVEETLVTAETYCGMGCPFQVTSGYHDGSLRMWKLNEKKGWACEGLIKAHSGAVKMVAASNCGTRIASCDQLRCLRIWEIMLGYRYAPAGEIGLSEPATVVKWFQGGSGHLLLAVVAGQQVRFYVEARCNDSEFSSWTCLASVLLESPANELVWDTQGAMLAISGAQVYVLSPSVYSSSRTASSSGDAKETELLLSAAQRLARPLPSYHPRFIFYLLMTGEQVQARACLRYLLSHPEEDISKHQPLKLGGIKKAGGANEGVKMWEFGRNFDTPDEGSQPAGNISGGPLTASEAQELTAFAKASNEGRQLLPLIELVQQYDQLSSLDRPGQRFALAVLHKQKQDPAGEILADSKSMAWALQSDCNDLLVDMIVPSSNMSWPALRALGVGYWFTDLPKLRSRMEKLARAQFLVKRDPKDCALLYIALERRIVLSGLFKLSHDERDKPLVEFLARNFQEERHKGAALKNAYVLMGKHRHELAAAFFILGGDLESAVSVCIRNMGDPQLALVICRLLDGIKGDTEKQFIRSDLLPDTKTRDKWLSSLFQCLLSELLEGVYELVGTEEDVDAPCFLDPEVGDYCHTVLARPGVTVPAFVSRRLLQISVLSLRKYSLPLQAAETLCKGLSAADLSRVETNWTTLTLGHRIVTNLLEQLVLQYLSQFIPYHPLWLNKDHDPKDDDFLQELRFLQEKLSVDIRSIVSSLANLSWQCGRPWFASWILNASESRAPADDG